MLSWRRTRCGRSRGETSRPRNVVGQPFVISSGCWGSVNGSPAALPGNTALLNATSPPPIPPKILMPRYGSGCAPTLRTIPVVGSDRPITMSAVRAGWIVNRKKIQRLWREEGLRVPQRRRRKRHGTTTAPDSVIADAPNRVWAVDFQFDVTTDGRPGQVRLDRR
jgi:hypothetical protein